MIEEFTPLKTYLGKTIAVKIDRPLGSKHPEHDFIYPLNYGFISETISSNAAPIDVYVLGVFKPVKMINGKVIAVIKRKDDNTDKIVIAANNKNYTNEQIQALVEFQERFFNTKIISNHKGL
ncbi:MAG TPA: inorganic diphosphatase [Patescibacteria group bacterium]